MRLRRIPIPFPMAVQLQSRAAVARQMANLWIDSLPPAELEAMGRNIEKVTAEDIQEAGRKYFPAWRMTVVAVGEERWSRATWRRSVSSSTRRNETQ